MRRLRLERLEPRYALTSGDLDPAFGDSGVVEEVFDSAFRSSETGQLIARQADGKVLVAGTTHTGQRDSFVIGRFHADGRPDTSFGDGGVAVTHFAGDASPRALAIQPDGKILLAEDSARFVRYRADGTVDSDFGVGGKSLNHGERLSIHSIEVQGDGGIIALAQDANRFSPSLGVVRINADGHLDSSFGWRGIGEDIEKRVQAAKLERQTDGRLVVAAIFERSDPDTGTAHQELYLARLTDDGEYDLSFSDDGWHSETASDSYVWYQDSMRLAIQADGKPVIATMTHTGGQSIPLIVRFNEDGSRDASFGTEGRVELSLNRRDMHIRSLAIGEGGRIAVLGESLVDSNAGFDPYSFIAVVSSSGALDSAWDGDGLLVLGEEQFMQLNGVIPLPSGGLLFGGAAPGLLSKDLALLAFDSTGKPDTTYSEDGIASIENSLPIRTVYSSKVQSLPDGRLLMAAQTPNGWVLRRYLPTGELDLSFAGDGERTVDEIDPGTYGFVEWIIQPDGSVIACLQRRSREIRLVRLLEDGSVDFSFGVEGVAATEIAGMLLEVMSATTDSAGNILIAGAGDTGNYSGDWRPSFSVRFLPNGTMDAGYGSQGVVIVTSDAGYHRQATLMPVISQNGEVAFFRQISSDTSPLLAQKLSVDGRSVSEVNLPGGYESELGNIFYDKVVLLAGGGYQLVGRGTVIDDNFRYGERTVIRRVVADGSLDQSYGENGSVVVELPPNQSDRIQVLTGQDGTVWVAVHSSDWDHPNNDIYITQISPTGTIDSSFGVNGTARLSIHGYDDLLDSAVLVTDGIILSGRTQTDGATNLVLAKLKIDVPPSPWQNPINPLNVSGDAEDTIAPIDALLIINALNDTAAGGARQLGPRESSATSFYDVNGDGWVTAIDALMVINWLNQNPVHFSAVGTADEGEGETESFSAEGTQSSSVDTQLDAMAIAWLVGGLETKSARRR